MRNEKVYNLVLAGFLIALGIMLPQLIGRIQILGQSLLPMHFPVLICGLVCGWKYGGVCGIVVPITASLIFTMPPLFPIAVAMAFELAAYAIIAAVCYKKMKMNIYLSLIISMLGGRIVYGIVNYLLMMINSQTYSLEVYFTTTFVNGIVGMIAQIIIVPLLVIAIQKASPLKAKRA